MNIDFIGVPFNLGCDKEGVQQAPGVIRESLCRFSNVKDRGDVVVKRSLQEDQFSLNKKIKYLKELLELCEELAVKVRDVEKEGRFPLIFGGDHSIALGSISGSVLNVENLGVVWIDAHCDINTDKTSPSGNAHGMILASLVGLGDGRMVELCNNQVKLNPKNVVLVAQRSFDSQERGVINDLGIHLFDMEYVNRNGMASVKEQIKEIFSKNGVQTIHISFDVDSVDPALAPGTGTPVDGGLVLEQVFELNDSLFDHFSVCAMDIVEFNPLLDKEEITKELCLSVVSRISSMKSND